MPTSPQIRKILAPAYAPCAGFKGVCRSMCWKPIEGHIPRGFYGATRHPSEVRLVMVLAEPGRPGPDEVYSGSASDLLDSAFRTAEHCYLYEGGPGHANARSIINRCFPDLKRKEAMRKVWITESVLCSVQSEDPTGRVPRNVEEQCVTTYLLPQLQLFPNAIVAAMGGKTYNRIRRHVPDVVKCGAIFPPGCNFKSTKDSWDLLVAAVRTASGG